ncbi:E3 ubiquitin-protein ligase Topors-like protein [Drosera capensis]
MEIGESKAISSVHATDAGDVVTAVVVDSNPCPICLGPVIAEAYLDRCFHKFCYSCILRWMNVVRDKRSSSRHEESLKCPLCKTENFSIIYGYDGSTFQRHHVHEDALERSFYTVDHKYRLQCYYTESGMLEDTFRVAQYWKFSKYLQPSKRLQHWLKRELQALTQVEDVEVLVRHTLGIVESFRQRNHSKGPRPVSEAIRQSFKSLVGNSVKPFVGERTERFVDELELFLCSGLTLEAYDNIYKKHIGQIRAEETSAEVENTDCDHIPTAVPFLHLFDDSSDEAD